MARNASAWRGVRRPRGTVHRVRRTAVAGEEEGEERRRARGERARERARRRRPRRRRPRGWRGGAPRGGHRRARERALRALAPRVHDASADFARASASAASASGRASKLRRVPPSARTSPSIRGLRPGAITTPPRDASPPGATRDRSNARARSAATVQNVGPPNAIGTRSTRPSRTPKRNPDRRARDDSLATGDAFTRESNRRPTLCLAARCCGPRARRGSA